MRAAILLAAAFLVACSTEPTVPTDPVGDQTDGSVPLFDGADVTHGEDANFFQIVMIEMYPEAEFERLYMAYTVFGDLCEAPNVDRVLDYLDVEHEVGDVPYYHGVIHTQPVYVYGFVDELSCRNMALTGFGTVHANAFFKDDRRVIEWMNRACVVVTEVWNGWDSRSSLRNRTWHNPSGQRPENKKEYRLATFEERSTLFWHHAFDGGDYVEKGLLMVGNENCFKDNYFER